MSRLYTAFYVLPIGAACALALGALLVWALLGSFSSLDCRADRLWSYGNRLFALLSILMIVHATVLSRSPSESTVILSPFASLQEAQTNPEIYRAMLMNMLLFLPLGMTMMWALPRAQRGKPLIVLLSALALSVLIEYCQWRGLLGRVETDDVICNTVGALIGCLAYADAKGITAVLSRAKQHREQGRR